MASAVFPACALALASSPLRLLQEVAPTQPQPAIHAVLRKGKDGLECVHVFSGLDVQPIYAAA